MYAVIETGGKQYRVEVGTELAVDLLDVEPGQEITLERVLLVADGEATAIGRPLVDGAAVSALVLRNERAAKLIVFKYKPKTRRRVKKGHRQERTVLRVTDVTLDGRSAAAEAAKAAEVIRAERERLEEAAAAQAAADAALAALLAERATPAPTPDATAQAGAIDAGPVEAVRQDVAPEGDAPGDAAPDVPAATDAATADAAPGAPAATDAALPDATPAEAAPPAGEAPPKRRRTRAAKQED
jgi:large subunit ribosomal protein L21